MTERSPYRTISISGDRPVRIDERQWTTLQWLRREGVTLAVRRHDADGTVIVQGSTGRRGGPVRRGGRKLDDGLDQVGPAVIAVAGEVGAPSGMAQELIDLLPAAPI